MQILFCMGFSHTAPIAHTTPHHLSYGSIAFAGSTSTVSVPPQQYRVTQYPRTAEAGRALRVHLAQLPLHLGYLDSLEWGNQAHIQAMFGYLQGRDPTTKHCPDLNGDNLVVPHAQHYLNEFISCEKITSQFAIHRTPSHPLPFVNPPFPALLPPSAPSSNKFPSLLLHTSLSLPLSCSPQWMPHPSGVSVRECRSLRQTQATTVIPALAQSHQHGPAILQVKKGEALR